MNCPYDLTRTFTLPALGIRVSLARETTMAEVEEPKEEPLYCPKCDREVTDPLVCGDCAAVICRACGTPLEKVDELGIG